ncbi:TonB-dependent receptor [Aquirufa sp. 2-AUSEE-184A6]|uniref:TonB-dependent receptor n=1 Tax=Aquirufa novilacunae TaxID=3139305 RepID=A0ABW8STG5_9BACT
MRFPYKIVIASSLSLVSMISYGQQKKEGTIQNEEFVTEKVRKIEVQPTMSRSFEALNEVPDYSKDHKIDYDFAIDKPQSLLLPSIKTNIIGPRAGEDLKSLYGAKAKNSIKIGAGNYGHNLLNGHFGYNPTEKESRGIYINHDANSNGPTDNAFSSRSENEVKVYSQSLWSKALLKGALDYRRTATNFYGKESFPANTPEDAYGVHYDQLKFNGDIYSATEGKKFSYQAGTEFSSLSGNLAPKEWLFKNYVRSSYAISSGLALRVNGEAILSNFTSNTSTNRQFFRLQPSISYDVLPRLNLVAGLNAVQDDELRLYPNVQVRYRANDFIRLFAGLEGNTQFNSYHSSLQINPWLTQAVTLQNTQQKWMVSGGLMGSNERNVSYELKASYGEYTKMAFFTSSAADLSQFDITYSNADAAISVLDLQADVKMSITDKIQSDLNVQYTNYANLGNLLYAYHRPNIQIALKNTIKVLPKFNVLPELYYLGGLYGFNPRTQKASTLDNILDINVKGEYAITEKFTASLSANNILGKNYQRYLFYPTQGFNFTATLAYSF